MKMVPLNVLTYLYCIVKNTILSFASYKANNNKKVQIIDKREHLKKIRKKLKAHYNAKEDSNNVRQYEKMERVSK
jgi:hypothetical protein